jgi:hypothetical protein
MKIQYLEQASPQIAAIEVLKACKMKVHYLEPAARQLIAIEALERLPRLRGGMPVRQRRPYVEMRS